MLNEKLRKLRKDKKKNQKQIADFLNIAQTTYSAYEVGNVQPSFETLKKLADYYNVSISYLLEEKNNETELQPNQIITIGRSGKKEIYELDEEDKELFDRLLEKYSKKNK